MDGLLIVDKPAGPTSHDVVARVRHVIREPKVGHAGTLDPMATGVLVLVVGRATRLARFLSTDDKVYDATVRLGTGTDTGDALGRPVGPPYRGPLPSREAIDRALDPFRGTFLQQPPAFSAKRIAGTRSHRLARARVRAAGRPAQEPPATLLDDSPTLPAPASVTAHAIEITSVEGDSVMLRIACSGGFYVRFLADDLGRALGMGAHLTALRRTRSSGHSVEQAVPFVELLDPDTGRGRAQASLVPLSEMLPELPRVTVTAAGAGRIRRGLPIGPAEATGGLPLANLAAFVRLVDQSGTLAAIAEPRGSGLLHPVVVLM